MADLHLGEAVQILQVFQCRVTRYRPRLFLVQPCQPIIDAQHGGKSSGSENQNVPFYFRVLLDLSSNSGMYWLYVYNAPGPYLDPEKNAFHMCSPSHQKPWRRNMQQVRDRKHDTKLMQPQK